MGWRRGRLPLHQGRKRGAGLLEPSVCCRFWGLRGVRRHGRDRRFRRIWRFCRKWGLTGRRWGHIQSSVFLGVCRDCGLTRRRRRGRRHPGVDRLPRVVAGAGLRLHGRPALLSISRLRRSRGEYGAVQLRAMGGRILERARVQPASGGSGLPLGPARARSGLCLRGAGMSIWAGHVRLRIFLEGPVRERSLDRRRDVPDGGRR